jgi:hypothetical protein
MDCWMSRTSQSVGDAGCVELGDPSVTTHAGFGVPLMVLGDHVVVPVVLGS